MNVRFELKTAITLLSVLTLCLFVVPTSQAKKGGGGKPPPEPPPPVETSCADYSSAFPAFAYSVQKAKPKSVTGYDIYLSNADGDCAIKIHTSDYKGSDLELSYSQNGNDGVLVWKQNNDEYAGRKDPEGGRDRIKMLRFQTNAAEVTSSLPVQSSTVIVVADNNSIRYIDLSADGNKIAVSYWDDSTGSNINSIREIDVSNCSSNCSMSAALFSTEEAATIGHSYSPLMDRIYFTGKYRNNSPDPLIGQYYIAFIEHQGSSWSAPRFITLSGNGFHGTTHYFRQPDVAIAELGNGPTEVLAFHYSQRDASTNFTLQIIDVGGCTAAGSEDCLTTSESNIVTEIIDGKYASFDDTHDANSVLFTTSTGIIMQHNIFSGVEAELVNGHQADSGF